MKRLTTLTLALIALFSTISFTSCIDDDGWYPMPPNGWNSTFYDRDLIGQWQLVQVNSQPVVGTKTNFLQFNGNGRGWYFYYDHGALYRERMAYWCEDFYYGQGYYELNMQYESGQSSTMTYWFTGRNTLWMRWNTSQGTVTYMYRYIDSVPW